MKIENVIYFILIIMSKLYGLLGSTLLHSVPSNTTFSSVNNTYNHSTDTNYTVLQHVELETIFSPQTEIIGTVFVEPQSAKCEEALDTLNNLVYQLQHSSPTSIETASGSPRTVFPIHDQNSNSSVFSPRLLIIIIPVDRNIETLRYYLNKYPYIYGLPHDSPQQMTIARAAGLGQAVALLFPEIIFFQASTGEPICTDGNNRLKQNLITFDTFPQCCYSNCFTVRCYPLLSDTILHNQIIRKNNENISLSMLLPSRLGPTIPFARMEENTMVRSMLYPGDTAIIRPVGNVLVNRMAASAALRTTGIENASPQLLREAKIPPTTSAIVYINAAIPNDDEYDSESDEEDMENEEEEEASNDHNNVSSSSSSSSTVSKSFATTDYKQLLNILQIQPNEILLPPGVMTDLGLQSGSTIALQPYLDIPIAQSITVAPLRTNTLTNNQFSSVQAENWLIKPWFGIEQEQDERKSAVLMEAVAAVRGGADEEKLAILLSSITAENTRNTGVNTGQESFSSLTPSKAKHLPNSEIQQPIKDANSNPHHTLSPNVHQHLNEAELSMLHAHMRNAICRYIPVATGGTIAIPIKHPTVSLDNIETSSIAKELLAQNIESSSSSSSSAAPQIDNRITHTVNNLNNYYIQIGEDGYPNSSGYAAYRIIETNPKFTAVIVGPDTQITCLSRPT